MHRLTRLSRTAALAIVVSVAPGAMAQVGGEFNLEWHSMDGGGVTFASGGAFTLGGTLGQFDASEPLSGGAFTLRPGFWPGGVAFPCSRVDLDVPYGVLDFSDVFAFLVAFGAMAPEADLDVPIGVFDFSDVFAFLVEFGAGCP